MYSDGSHGCGNGRVKKTFKARKLLHDWILHFRLVIFDLKVAKKQYSPVSWPPFWSETKRLAKNDSIQRESFHLHFIFYRIFLLTMKLFVYRNKLITENIFSPGNNTCPSSSDHWMWNMNSLNFQSFYANKVHYFAILFTWWEPWHFSCFLFEFYHKQRTTFGFFWYMSNSVKWLRDIPLYSAI